MDNRLLIQFTTSCIAGSNLEVTLHDVLNIAHGLQLLDASVLQRSDAFPAFVRSNARFSIFCGVT